MNNYWIPVVAALGSSALTGLVAFGLDARRSGQSRLDVLRERRLRAYSQMISRAASLALAAGAMHLTVKIRSGLTEGFDIALRQRKPAEPTELHDWLMKELGPLVKALSEVWIVGTPKAVKAANEVMRMCNMVLNSATKQGEARTPLVRFVAGEKWTAAQLESWQADIDGLAEARKRLAEIARSEMGIEFTPLFTIEDSQSVH